MMMLATCGDQSAATKNQRLPCSATVTGCLLTLNYLGTSSVNPSAASLSSWSEPPAPNILSCTVVFPILMPRTLYLLQTLNMYWIMFAQSFKTSLDLQGWEVHLSAPSLTQTIETSFTRCYSFFVGTGTLCKQLQQSEIEICYTLYQQTDN